MSQRLLIFDCDGVLVDSELIGNRMLADALCANGYNIKPAECRQRFLGMSLPQVFREVSAELGRDLPADTENHILDRYEDVFGRKLKPIPGVHEMLDALDGPRAVASSGSMTKMKVTLPVTRLWNRFAPHIYSARLVGRGKPAPDIFLHVAEKMAADPTDCIVIEDSVHGVAAAITAGMGIIGFTGGSHCGPGHGTELLQAGAGAVFNDMRLLPELLASYSPTREIPRSG
jgi:HAD superfamily hydrolase (TIGR01509 family)